MTENYIEKAEVLFLQNRFIDAEKLLNELLSVDPKNVDGLMILAQVCLGLDKTDKAKILIDSAIGIDPEYAPLFFVKAKVLIQRDGLVEAESNIKYALKLSPVNANYYSLLASIKFIQQQYKGALRYTDKALAIDPSHVASLNTRTTTLLLLDKKEDSLKASAEALREAPNNAYSHCNAGWNLLEKGKTNTAMSHFREALSIDPNFNYAKEGMIEALKTKNDFYYFYLKCSDWINNSYSYAPRVLLVICFICFKMIGNFTFGERLGLSIVLPALALVYFFLYTKMVMPPFSNLFLRLNSYAKHLFDKTDIIVSNFVGICFLVFLSGIILYFIFGGVGYLAISVFGFTMMLPCSIMLAHPKIKMLMIVYAVSLILLGIYTISIIFLNGKALNVFTYIFLIGFLLYPWVSILMVSLKDKKE